MAKIQPSSMLSSAGLPKTSETYEMTRQVNSWLPGYTRKQTANKHVLLGGYPPSREEHSIPRATRPNIACSKFLQKSFCLKSFVSQNPQTVRHYDRIIRKKCQIYNFKLLIRLSLTYVLPKK